MNLYTCSINVETLEIEEDCMEVDHYDVFSTGFATFDDWDVNLIYAESLVSAKECCRIVLEKAAELFNRFDRAKNTMEHYMEAKAE